MVFINRKLFSCELHESLGSLRPLERSWRFLEAPEGSPIRLSFKAILPLQALASEYLRSCFYLWELSRFGKFCQKIQKELAGTLNCRFSEQVVLLAETENYYRFSHGVMSVCQGVSTELSMTESAEAILKTLTLQPDYLLRTLTPLPTLNYLINEYSFIELLNNNSHGLSPPGGLVSPSGGFVSILCDQGLHFASIKLCQASWMWLDSCR